MAINSLQLLASCGKFKWQQIQKQKNLKKMSYIIFFFYKNKKIQEELFKKN